MNKTALSMGIAAVFMMGGSSVMAGEVQSGITNFTAKTTASADEVNKNFSLIIEAVDGNAGDIATNATAIGDTASGLVKNVADNEAAIGNASSGLVKDIADNKAAIAAIDTTSAGANATNIATNATAITSKLDASALGANSTVLTSASTTSSNSVDGNALNIATLDSGVTALETVVGNATSGLVKDVADLQTGGSCPADMATVGSLCVDKNESLTGGFTWVQAQQACVTAGKRLLTNSEWTLATFYINSQGITGMANGYYEWTADWVDGTQRLLRGDKTGGTGNGIETYTPWDPTNTNGEANRGYRCAK